jgi:hypothetical protein
MQQRRSDKGIWVPFVLLFLATDSRLFRTHTSAFRHNRAVQTRKVFNVKPQILIAAAHRELVLSSYIASAAQVQPLM